MITRTNTTFTVSTKSLSEEEIKTDLVQLKASGYLPVFHFKKFGGKSKTPLKWDDEIAEVLEYPYINYNQWDSNGIKNSTKIDIIECMKMPDLIHYHKR